MCSGFLSKRSTAFPYTVKTRRASLHGKAHSESIDLVTYEGNGVTVHKKYPVIDVSSDEQHLVFKLLGGGELVGDLVGNTSDPSRWLEIGERVRGFVHSGLSGAMTSADL